MKTPTIEEVKQHFKDAEIIKDYYNDTLNLNNISEKGIYKFRGNYYADDNFGQDYFLWSNYTGYSEIVKYKDKENKYKVNYKGIDLDVYDVLKAFKVTNPATQHAIKKLLKGGERGYKDINQDYKEAIDSINRAIELNQ